MEPDQNIPDASVSGENASEFSDYGTESESFADKVKAFFSDRRKLLITAVILLLVAGAAVAVFAFRNRSQKVSTTTAQVGQLPIAGLGSDFTVTAGYPADGEIVLSWSTDKLCDGRVYYGQDSNYGFWADDQDTLGPSKYSKQHRVVVAGLNPVDVYHFKATSLCEDNTLLSSGDFTLKPAGDLNAPTVKITNHSSGDTLSKTSQICAEAKDDRSIQRLILLIDGRPIESVEGKSSYCFSVDTQNLANGSHDMRVLASDGTSNTFTDPLAVVIANPGGGKNNTKDKYGCVKIDPAIRVALQSIKAGDTLTGRKDLNAVIESAGGYTIAKLILAVDDWPKAEDVTAPYNFTLDTRTYVDGSHNIAVIAQTTTGTCNDYRAASTTAVKFSNPAGANSAPLIFAVTAASTSDSITVKWSSDKPTDSVVKYSAGSVAKSVSKPGFTTSHVVVLTGLTQNTWYSLTLEGTAENSLTSSYSTSAATGNPPYPPCTAGNCPPSLGGPPPPSECTAVNTSLVVTLTSPASNTTVSGDMALAASANQAVAQMLFYIGNVQIGSDATSPYGLTVNSAVYPNGTYIIRAIAVSSNGECSSISYTGPHTSRITISNTVAVKTPCTQSSCQPPAGPPPPEDCTSVDSSIVVTLTSPSNNSTVNGSMDLSAGANKPVGKMLFYIGDVRIGSDSSPPYEMTVNSASYPNGTYVIRAIAVSSAGLCSSISYTGPHTAVVTINNTTNPPCPGGNCAILPTVTLYASAPTIAPGQNTNLVWTTSNADSCAASNGWSGSKPLFGSLSVSPPQTASYVLTCTNSNGSAAQTTAVTVSANPGAPFVSLSAAPSTITVGQSSTLTWTAERATSCTASNGWSGSKSASGGSQIVSPTTSSTYALDCTGPGGAATQSIIITVGTTKCSGSSCAPPGCTTKTSAITVTLTAPQNNASLSGTANLSATASGGTLAKMMFLVGNDAVLEDLSEPYSVSFDTTSLANGDYLIRAVGKTASGECTDWSNTGPHAAQVTITNNAGKSPDYDTKAPTAPANLKIDSVTQTSVKISWSASTDNVAVSGYDVYRNSQKINSVTILNFNDTGLGRGTVYTYYVKARDAANNVSEASNTVEAVTDEAFEISGVQAVPDDIFVNFKFTTNQPASSVIAYGETSSNLNKTITVGSGVTFFKASSNRLAGNFWQKISRRLANLFPKALAAFPSVTLNADSSRINRGQSVRLSWTSSDAAACSSSWAGTTAKDGSVVLKPARTTRYVITCTNNDGSDKSALTVEVLNPYSAYASGLKADTTYYYKIVSTSAADPSVKAETSVLNFQTAPPPAFSDLTSSISWTGGTGDGLVAYSRLPLSDPNLTPVVVKAGSSGPGAYTAVLIGLAAQRTYYYQYQTVSGWTGCAQENGVCDFPGSGNKIVRYGANGSYAYKFATGSIACNNSIFGDPLVGTAKTCDYVSSTAVDSGQLDFITPAQ